MRRPRFIVITTGRQAKQAGTCWRRRKSKSRSRSRSRDQIQSQSQSQKQGKSLPGSLLVPPGAYYRFGWADMPVVLSPDSWGGSRATEKYLG